jgi:uncharacterized delta-60 repeat protein
MKKILITTILSLILTGAIYAQSGSIDNTFNPNDLGFGYGDGVNYGVIFAISLQSDGKIVVGGNQFTSYNGTIVNDIARLNSDGTLDPTFNTGVVLNCIVETISIQNDGKIIAAGSGGITRLNIDGTIDASFNIGTGFNGGSVHAISVQTDGKIIVGGNFITYNGISVNNFIRLNSDGTFDGTFNTGTGTNSDVFEIDIQSDGKIIISGQMTLYNGVPIKRIARLNIDGTLDTSFNTVTGVSNAIYSTSIQNDGKIVIGGHFNAYNGISMNNIARLNNDGTLDSSFNLGMGSNLGPSIYTTSIQSDGKIIIGGDFTTYNGIPMNRIARLNADGTLDNSFNIGLGLNVSANTTSIQNDGKIIIGGDFTSYNGATRRKIARLNADGTIDNIFMQGTGANNAVLTTSIQNDGKIIIGGRLTTFNNTTNNYITRLNTDGTQDISFITGTGGVSSSTFGGNAISTTSIQSDGKIIIGGDLISFDGIPVNRIARLNSNGSLDVTFSTGTGANNNVFATSIQIDGKIIIGGNFTDYNGYPINRIARLNTDGTLDVTFNPGTGTNNIVRSISIQSDGKIIIGGDFTAYNGAGRNYIARLNSDGTLDISFNPGFGANAPLRTASIQSDGKIIIGGDFTSYNVTSRNYISRLNSDGTLDLSFNPGAGASNSVQTTSILSDGKILIGGDFTSYNGTVRNNIALLNIDGSLDSVFNQGIGASNSVYSISIQSDGNIIIGGNFTSYNSTGRNRVARIIGSTPTKITSNSNLPRNFVYPNPFSQQTTLKAFNLLKSASLTICNSQGQLVKEINSITSQTITIMRDNLPSGLYFVKLTEDDKVIISERLVICE